MGKLQTITVDIAEVCEGATSPVITFTGSGNTGNPEYRFVYTIMAAAKQLLVLVLMMYVH
jgi:hypothetical protein